MTRLSLGITVDEASGKPCLLLRVADEQAVRQRELDVDGHIVQVIVRPNYATPRPG